MSLGKLPKIIQWGVSFLFVVILAGILLAIYRWQSSGFDLIQFGMPGILIEVLQGKPDQIEKSEGGVLRTYWEKERYGEKCKITYYSDNANKMNHVSAEFPNGTYELYERIAVKMSAVYSQKENFYDSGETFEGAKLIRRFGTSKGAVEIAVIITYGADVVQVLIYNQR